MKPKAIWLTTIGVSSVVLMAAAPVGQTMSQVWKPEVAHAMKVTARLIKSKTLTPTVLARRAQITPAPGQSATAPRANATWMRVVTEPFSVRMPDAAKYSAAKRLALTPNAGSAQDTAAIADSMQPLVSASPLGWEHWQSSWQQAAKPQKNSLPRSVD